MGWGEYARSRMSVRMVLLFWVVVFVNLCIIEGFKLMLHFEYTAPIDVTVLAQMNEEYEGATILDTFLDDDKLHLWDSDHTAYLLETPEGQRKMVVVEKHFLLDRYRYWDTFSADVPIQEGLQPVSPGTLYQQAYAWIIDSSEFESFHVGQNYGPGVTLLLIPMIILEFLAYCFLFKREDL